MNEKFLNSERVAELWAAIKTQLAKKLEATDLTNYPTTEAMAAAIAAALGDYSTTTEMEAAIAAALKDYMTSDDVATAIAAAAGIKTEIVDELPAEGKEMVIYFVPNTENLDKNIMDEYMWINGDFELVGSTALDVTKYWAKGELEVMTADELYAILSGETGEA